MIAALYVDPKGPYANMPGVDPWDASRDARNYRGPHPVVAHPPCNVWCQLARLNERRYGIKVGDDDGKFADALASVRAFGGVLEHPALSLAWDHHGLTKPTAIGWQQVHKREWVAEVWQSAYGHKATKRTWLLYVGDLDPFPFNTARNKGSHMIGGWYHKNSARKRPRLSPPYTHMTPPAFAEYLVDLARNARREVAPSVTPASNIA